jgi:hypothetical protein
VCASDIKKFLECGALSAVERRRRHRRQSITEQVGIVHEETLPEGQRITDGQPHHHCHRQGERERFVAEVKKLIEVSLLLKGRQQGCQGDEEGNSGFLRRLPDLVVRQARFD